LAEIIAFTQPITRDDVIKVENYLSQKYQNPLLMHPPQDHTRLNEALINISQYAVQHSTDIVLGLIATMLAVVVLFASRVANPSEARQLVVLVFLALTAAAIASFCHTRRGKYFPRRKATPWDKRDGSHRGFFRCTALV
jgi:hypothetical protein